MSDPTKSGDEPITEDQIVDDDTTKALDEQAAAETAIAEEHKFTGEAMTPEEYDKIGKGDNYKPHNTVNTFPGVGTAVAGSPEARRQQGNARTGQAAARVTQGSEAAAEAERTAQREAKEAASKSK